MENKPNKQQLDPLPDASATLSEIAEFWDTHSFADYEQFFEEVTEYEINLSTKRGRRVTLAQNLVEKIDKAAEREGVGFETLVNLWLQEYIATAETQIKIGLAQ